MKQYYLILAFLLASVILPAQPQIEWERLHSQLGSQITIAASDGGSLLGRTTYIYEEDWPKRVFEITKVDEFGYVVWQKTAGNWGDLYLHAMAKTADGGFVLGGRGRTHQESPWAYDFYIIKTDASGNVQWEKHYGGADEDVVYSITQTHDGGYIASGYSMSDAGGDKSENPRGGPGDGDFWVVKMDSSGNLMWEKTIGSASWEEENTIQQLADGGYVIGATSDAPASGEKSEDPKGGAGEADMWLIKLSATGTVLWDKTIGGAMIDNYSWLEATSDGGFIIAGSSYSNMSFDKSEDSKGASDCWVIKMDSLGNKLWDKTYGGASYDGARYIQQTTDGGFVVGGGSSSDASGDKSENALGGGDFWILKLAADGTKEWDKTIGTSDSESLQVVLQTLDQGYFISGTSGSTNAIRLVKLRGVPQGTYNGLVTGSGWIYSPTGAAPQYPFATDKALFSVVADYEGGVYQPSGNVTFKFKNGKIDFASTAIDSLTIVEKAAQIQGVGTNNKQGNFGFYLSVIDGSVAGQSPTDKFRIRIWDQQSQNILYDNEINSPIDNAPSTGIGGIITVIPNTPAGSTMRIADYGLNGLSGLSDLALTVYPNPVRDNFQIKNLPDEGMVEIKLVNLEGKTVKEYKMESHSNLELALPSSVKKSGIYLLSVSHDEATPLYLKLAVER